MRLGFVFSVVVLIVSSLAACAPAPRAAPTIDDVAAERALRAEQRVDTLLATYGDYLANRWPGIELPPTSIQRWAEQSAWPKAFETCASRESGQTVLTNPAVGIYADPFPANDEQLRELETSIYICQGRFPPPILGINDPGPVEIEWVTTYARSTLPACLRRQGVIAPPLGTDPFAILSGGSTPQWDPYVTARGDAAELRRLQALCPHPSTVLGTLSAVGEPR